MTTKVYITNDKNSSHKIRVVGRGGTPIDLLPGEKMDFHVWTDGTTNVSGGLFITEGDSIIREYKNPNGLTGPVFIEDDGTIRELNMRSDI